MMHVIARRRQRGFFVLPGGSGLVATRPGGSGPVCPNYTLVILAETDTTYTPPSAAGSANLVELPCPYTPPTPT
jgi:hypothetical protein